MSAKFSSPNSRYFSPTFKSKEKESVLQAYPKATIDVKSPCKEAPRKSFADIYGYDPWERYKAPVDFVKEELRIYYFT